MFLRGAYIGFDLDFMQSLWIDNEWLIDQKAELLSECTHDQPTQRIADETNPLLLTGLNFDELGYMLVSGC